MVRTTPGGTTTFAGAVTVDDIVQLEVTVQSPDEGGVHGASVIVTLEAELLMPSFTAS